MWSMSVFNITKRMLLKGEFVQITEKMFGRLLAGKKNKISPENMNFLLEHAIDVEDFAKEVDGSLWQETVAETNQIRIHAKAILKDIEFNLGGGGAFDLLYFLVRYLNPQIIVETGVAAGYSSYACLKAIKVNETGQLLSSDLPYFRLPEPENFIGVLVPEGLRQNWKLFIEGDRKNFEKIIDLCDEIDLFHYDSDKSYSGRTNALYLLSSKFTDKSVILMDDIQNNDFFFDFVKNQLIRNVQIFRFEGKYLAMWWGDKVSFGGKNIEPVQF